MSIGALATTAAKPRRQKIIVVAGVAVLALLLAIQGPKMLKALRGSPAAAPADDSPLVTTVVETPSGAPPQSLAAVLAAERQPARSVSRLYEFDRFSYKDPFAAPASSERATAEPDPAAPAPAEPASEAPAPAEPAPAEDAAGDTRPGDKHGYTVVVHSLPTSVGLVRAKAAAREVSAKLKRPAGVLRSSNHPNLRPGYFVVYTGSYASLSAARAALAAARAVNHTAYTRHIGG